MSDQAIQLAAQGRQVHNLSVDLGKMLACDGMSSRLTVPSRWSAMASTMRRHWQQPQSASPWAGGTDVALETADAALLRNRVVGVSELIELSRTVLSNIWQNITIALGLKAVFLITTLLGISSLWMAILADTGATVLVTANALRLLGVAAHPAERSQEK